MSVPERENKKRILLFDVDGTLTVCFSICYVFLAPFCLFASVLCLFPIHSQRHRVQLLEVHSYNPWF